MLADAEHYIQSNIKEGSREGRGKEGGRKRREYNYIEKFWMIIFQPSLHPAHTVSLLHLLALENNFSSKKLKCGQQYYSNFSLTKLRS